MFLDEPAKSPALGLKLAEWLNALSSPQGSLLIDRALSQELDVDVVSVGVVATNYRPAFYAARAGDYSLLLIGGCTVLDHATKVIDGYRGSFLAAVREPVNEYIRENGEAIKAEALMNGLLSGPKVILAGHSLGGAAAEHAAASLQRDGRGAAVKVVTFGAPKPGGLDFAREVGPMDRVRWFCEDDPVPLLPPSPDLLPALLLVRSPIELARFTNFIHPRGGTELNVNGTFSKRVLPELATLNATASLAGWLLAVDGSSTSGHHLTTYQARLAYWLQQNPAANPDAIELAAAEEPGAQTRGQLTTQQRQSSKALGVISDNQGRPEVDLPAGSIFHYERVGKFHLVTFNGQTVVATSRERSARAVARRGNEWLRVLQRQAIVMTDELAAQFTEYLRKAQTAEAGFTPLMNVRLPDDLS